MRKLLMVFMAFVSFNAVKAQQKNSWTLLANPEKITTDKAVQRLSFPKEFKLFNLDVAPLRKELFSVAGNVSKHSTVISLPNAEGDIEDFEVFEASNFEPELQARFPEIRAYSGRGLTDKSATLKLSISPQGIQTMVFRSEKENEFIEAYSSDHNVYAVFKSQRKPGASPWRCSTVDKKLVTGLDDKVAAASGTTLRSGGNLKTMRLAQSVTAEYSNYFGATSASQVALVLAAVNATLTRCNGVYERDLALHLNLISNTTSVFYYTASSDPYSSATAGAAGSWTSELVNTLHSVIGDANFDIGHLFGASGGGGNAGCIGCICGNTTTINSDGSTNYKGGGYTSPADAIPQGDNFDIDYVVHEVGHQLGANHTFSMDNEGTGVNKEIGSGITIMGYAGITSYDVASHSIDAYHEASIAQIQSNLNSKTCPVTTTITNATPVVAAVSNYTIPKSTPFALTGSATDADASNVLTYSWEQNDNASSSQTNASSKASATKASGPNWISFKPTTSPTRYFPQLSSILTGATTTGPMTGGDAGVTTEALSSVARTLNFRLTVRDNAPYSSTAPISVGQTQFTDMVVTVSSAAGPFAVSAPNTAVSYAGNSTQTITWAVASTTASPVSCANVKISLSTDGGQTFPTVLAASTPNDGTEALVIPNTPTTTARIKVEAVGNIFFDISNTNFTITASASCGTATGLASSAVTTTGATVSWAAVSSATSYKVEYKLNSSGTWTTFAAAQTATTASLTGLTSGSLYDWRVTATCASGTGTAASAQFTTQTVCVAPTGLASSSITTTGATVSWTAVTAATSYAVDYKLNSSSTWTSFSTAQTATSASLTGLTASSLYDWRVSATCPSGTTSATAAQFTTAAPAVCNAPTALTSSSITASSATVSWTAASGAVSYKVEYKLNSSGTWTTFASAQTAVSASLTGLTASSLYDWRVTTNCSSGSSSAVAAQFTTTAPAVCNAPTGLASTPGTTTASLSWTAVSGAVSYAVDYKLNSSSTWISVSTAQTATTASLTGLTASSLYDWRVTTNCSSNSSTAVAAQFTTTAAPACSDNYEPNNTSATATAATLNTPFTSMVGSAADADWYTFTTTSTNTNVKVVLNNLPADYDLSLYNSSLTLLGSSSNTSTTAEQVIQNTSSTATYYVKVAGFSSASLGTYNFTAGTAAATSVAGKLTVSDLAQGNNNGTTTLVTSTSASSGYTGASGTFNAGAAARIGALSTASGGSAYFEFTLTPTAGNAVTLTNISFGARSTSTGPVSYTLRSSLDGYATDISTGSITANSTWALKTNSFTVTGAIGAAVTFRIYGYGGAGSAGTNVANWRIDDLVLTGSSNAFNASSCYTLTINTGSSAFSRLSQAIALTAKSFNIYPVPARESVLVSFNAEKSGKFAVTVMNELGEKVKTISGTSVQGANTSKINLHGLTSGIYIMRLDNGTKIEMKKFIVGY